MKDRIELLLEAEREIPVPPRALQNRVRARISASLVGASAVGTAGSAGAVKATGVMKAAGAVKAAAGGAILSATVKTSLIVAVVAAAGTAGGLAVRQERSFLPRTAQPARGKDLRRVTAAVRPPLPSEAIDLMVDDSQMVPRLEDAIVSPPGGTGVPAPEQPPAARVTAAPVNTSVADSRVAPLVKNPIASPARAAGASPLRRTPVRPGSETASEASLAEESALVNRAAAALGRNAPDQAIAALDEHARRFSAGQLAEEREALGIQALVASGESEEARTRAVRFRHRFPHSIQLDVISSALAEIR